MAATIKDVLADIIIEANEHMRIAELYKTKVIQPLDELHQQLSSVKHEHKKAVNNALKLKKNATTNVEKVFSFN